MQVENVTVVEHLAFAGDCRVLKFVSEKIAPKVKPGQFVHLRVDESNKHVLRRPFSVFKAGKKSLSILYKIVGAGTEIMSNLRPGDKVSMIGPLGNGFPAPAKNVKPVLIAGGYGSAALYLLAERARNKGTIFIGGKLACDLLGADEFRRLGWKVILATEDGSEGQKGMVTCVVEKWLAKKPKKGKITFYACGPMDMLKAVTGIAMDGGWQAWLSLDKRMGCGMGACLACVQKINVTGKHSRGESWKWARICKEGPVFECREIVWE